jgi:hypothetical protein
MQSGGVQRLADWGSWRVWTARAEAPACAGTGGALLVFDRPGDPGASPTLAAVAAIAPRMLRAVWGAAATPEPDAPLVLPGADGWFLRVVSAPLSGPGVMAGISEARRGLGTAPLIVALDDALSVGVALHSLLALFRTGLAAGNGNVLLLAPSADVLKRLSADAGQAATDDAAKSSGGLVGMARTAGAFTAAVPPLAPLGQALRLGALIGQSKGAQKAALLAAGATFAAAAGAAGMAFASEQSRSRDEAENARGIGKFRPDCETPVSRLASLMLEELEAGPRSNLIRAARTRKARGSDEAVVEEWLYEQPDLAAVLAGRFAPFELSVIARKRWNKELNGADSGRRLAESILSCLGLTTEGDSAGLAPVLKRIGVLSEGLQSGSIDPRAVGGVLGPALERVGKDLLRFHLRLAFQNEQSLPRLVKKLEGVDPPGGRFSLGTIDHALKAFDRWRAPATNRGAGSRHRELYGDRSLHLPPLPELVRRRNELSHDRGGDLAEIAREFLQDAERWVRSLREEKAGPRLYPAVVEVESVSKSGSAFRALGLDDEGRPEELLLDHSLAPGSRWFMVPRSNPKRVSPLLIPLD